MAKGDDALLGGQALLPDEFLISKNGFFKLLYQLDGNLVLYDVETNIPLWASNTQGRTLGQVLMQHDGNFCMYDADGRCIFATSTQYHQGALFVLHDDGNLVIYQQLINKPHTDVIWARPQQLSEDARQALAKHYREKISRLDAIVQQELPIAHFSRRRNPLGKTSFSLCALPDPDNEVCYWDSGWDGNHYKILAGDTPACGIAKGNYNNTVDKITGFPEAKFALEQIFGGFVHSSSIRSGPDDVRAACADTNTTRRGGPGDGPRSGGSLDSFNSTLDIARTDRFNRYC